ncbi:hypothetical protein [Polynucleobacter hallstattensis]|uniref:hypothetical protein n=1 Tax=Polynucleobacter hallstattensis TaxID=1855586 RepID=UPI001C0BD5C4|nr:hypothetical protein [Polynucleobacter hallstattensis]MBU3562152.1 hypothetical protein [Polynucleobacter hallstattensis]
MSRLLETVEKLKQTGTIGLEDFRNLKMKELEVLTEEIKEWCLYGNGKPKNWARNIKSIKA